MGNDGDVTMGMIKVTFPYRFSEIESWLRVNVRGGIDLIWNGYDWCDVGFEDPNDAAWASLRWS